MKFSYTIHSKSHNTSYSGFRSTSCGALRERTKGIADGNHQYFINKGDIIDNDSTHASYEFNGERFVRISNE